MILFIAPNPLKVKEREGFLQRVAAIDDMFVDEEKIYSEDLLDAKSLASALIKARVVYVHSMYNANKILKCYPDFSHKIITDLHGVVPEEEAYADNQEMFRIMDATEKEVFKSGKYFVAVTQAMVDHFKSKYPRSRQSTWIVLPIYLGSTTKFKRPIRKVANNIVYAGGGQRWQNADLMVQTINELSGKYKFTILSHDPMAFQGISESARQHVILKSVPSQQVAEYYAKSSLGFVLRTDNLVNKVACPTKLIEYLSYGIVPIVLSEHIGDFLSLGYSYITVKDLKHNPMDEDAIHAAAQNNYRVYGEFLRLINNGKTKLLKTVKSIQAKNKQSDPSYALLLESKIDAQEDINKMLRYEYQIEVYQTKIKEYAELAEHYKSKYHRIQAPQGVLAPLRRVRHRLKRSNG